MRKYKLIYMTIYNVSDLKEIKDAKQIERGDGYYAKIQIYIKYDIYKFIINYAFNSNS